MEEHMVSLLSLWLPILLSGVAVFLVSSIVHMALGYHASDFRKLPAEDDVMRALSPFNLAPGEYMFPAPSGMASMKDPAFIEKKKRGPNGLLNVFPNEMPGMGGALAKWFVYNVVVSFFAAYLASRFLQPGARGAEVFRLTATIGFLSYGMAHVADSVWWSRSWSVTAKNLFDALLYGSATGAVFMWMWPK
jgi:hypothetical protein